MAENRKNFSPQQQLIYELQLVETESEALVVWSRYADQLAESAFILSVPGSSPFSVPLPQQFGQLARLVSAFASDDLVFLNSQIVHEIEKGGSPQIRFTYTIWFDTNAASELRWLFTESERSQTKDLRILLHHFHGKEPHWHPVPYLFENGESILKAENSQVIFETIVAAEKMADIDSKHFMKTGELRLVQQETAAVARAAKKLSDFSRKLRDGLNRNICENWEAMYVSVLAIALEQIRCPSQSLASKKIKNLVLFMDREIHAVFVELLSIAWEWFNGNPKTIILNRLQKNAPDLIRKAKNISWDIYHLIQLRQVATYDKRNNAFLIPYFLTFDRDMANLLQLCAVKSCLICETFHYPTCFPALDPDRLGPSIFKDQLFCDRYLSPDANMRRMDYIEQHGPPDLTKIRQELEAKLSTYQPEKNLSSGS